jgi:hypothetical protein
LKGIHTLVMSGCDQETITDAAFVHLAGINALYMSDCSQATITNKAFLCLKDVPKLSGDEACARREKAMAEYGDPEKLKA